MDAVIQLQLINFELYQYRSIKILMMPVRKRCKAKTVNNTLSTKICFDFFL